MLCVFVCVCVCPNVPTKSLFVSLASHSVPTKPPFVSLASHNVPTNTQNGGIKEQICCRKESMSFGCVGMRLFLIVLSFDRNEFRAKTKIFTLCCGPKIKYESKQIICFVFFRLLIPSFVCCCSSLMACDWQSFSQVICGIPKPKSHNHNTNQPTETAAERHSA